MAEWDITAEEIYYTEAMKEVLAQEYARLLAEESERTA